MLYNENRRVEFLSVQDAVTFLRDYAHFEYTKGAFYNRQGATWAQGLLEYIGKMRAIPREVRNELPEFGLSDEQLEGLEKEAKRFLSP